MSTDAVMTPATDAASLKKEAKRVAHEARAEEQRLAREAKEAKKEANRAARVVIEAEAKQRKLEKQEVKKVAFDKREAEQAVLKTEALKVKAEAHAAREAEIAVAREAKAAAKAATQEASEALRVEHARIKAEKGARTVIVSVDLLAMDKHLASVCGPDVEKVDLPFWFRNSAEIPVIFKDAASAKKFTKKVAKNVSIKTSSRPQPDATTTAHFALANYDDKERSEHESACEAALAKVPGVIFKRVVTDFCILEFASAAQCTKFKASSISVHGEVVEIKAGETGTRRRATRKRAGSITSAEGSPAKKMDTKA